MPTIVPRSSQFWVVCLEDDALDDVPAEVMRAYELSRDYGLLEPFIEKMEVKPTRYRCYPLRPEFQSKVPALMIPQADVDDLWELFSRHCDKVLGLLDADGAEVKIKPEDIKGKQVIPAHFRGDEDHPPTIPMKDFREVAQVVIHKGTRSDNDPFSQQGTWARSRMNRMRSQSANSAARALLEKIAEKSRTGSSSDSTNNERSTEDDGASSP